MRELKKPAPFVPVIVVDHQKRGGLGEGRDEGDVWWVRFDDGRCYSVPASTITVTRELAPNQEGSV